MNLNTEEKKQYIANCELYMLLDNIDVCMHEMQRGRWYFNFAGVRMNEVPTEAAYYLAEFLRLISMRMNENSLHTGLDKYAKEGLPYKLKNMSEQNSEFYYKDKSIYEYMEEYPIK